MRVCRRVRRLVVVLVAAGLLLSACEGLDPPPVIRNLSPGEGVTVWQVSFLFPNAPQEHSSWGRLLVDPAQVEQATGIRGGRLNVVTEGGWAVCNAPVLPSSEPPYAIYFDLGLDTPAELKDIPLYIGVSDRALGALDEQREPPHLWPVSRWDWAAEGVTTILDLGPPPVVRPVADRILAGRVTDAWYQSLTNEQCAHMQCVPMAIANALAYLHDMGVVTIPHNHAPGLGGDGLGTLVGTLDEYTGRAATSRASGNGLWFTPAVRGSFEYLEAMGLSSELSHRHQGYGYGAEPHQRLPGGNYAAFSSVSVDDGPVATFDWIFPRVAGGAGVVAVVQYASGGGHAVRITAAGRDDAGQQWVRYSHDALQTHRDLSDLSGLENVVVELLDLDSDGTLNLGSLSREVVFVWAHR